MSLDVREASEVDAFRPYNLSYPGFPGVCVTRDHLGLITVQVFVGSYYRAGHRRLTLPPHPYIFHVYFEFIKDAMHFHPLRGAALGGRHYR